MRSGEKKYVTNGYVCPADIRVFGVNKSVSNKRTRCHVLLLSNV